MGFDLGTIDLKEEGTDMPVRHPVTDEVLVDAEGNISTIKLVGQDSTIYRKAANAITNRRARKMKMPKAEVIESDALELVSKCTVGWSNLLVNGEEPTSADALYRGNRWLREQADAWIHDRANYLGN